MSDYIRLDPWSVVTWAQATAEAFRSTDEPPKAETLLADLENTLLVNRKPNLRRLAHPVKGRFWLGSRGPLYMLLMLIPLLAPLLMYVGLMAAGDSGSYRPAVAFLTTLAVSLFVIAFLAVFYLAWRRRNPRRRSTVPTIFSCLYVVVGALSLVLYFLNVTAFDVPVDWSVLPLWILLALCVASVVYQVKSPPDPAWSHLWSASGESAPNMTRLEPRRLHPEDRARMLDERDQAVRILVERGLLTDVDPDELSTRPLGELHLDREGHHA